MNMNTLRQLIAVLLLALLSVSAVSAQDEPELDFPILSNGDTVSDTFDADKDGQLYAFFASTGDRVRINMAQTPATSLLDPLLVLLSADGQVIAVDNDGGANPYFSALITDAQIPADGLYFVLATHSEGLRFALEDIVEESALDAGFNYTLTISGITTPRNAPAALTIPVLDFGANETVSLTTQNAVYLATFEGEAGDSVSLATADSSGDEVDTILALFDTEGARIAINDDANGVNSEIDADLEDEGLYLVMLTAYEFEMTNTPRFDWDGEGVTTFTLD